MIFWLCVTIIATTSIISPLYMNYKKQKLIEERKTNNMALAYQILSTRPDVTMNDIEHLLKISDNMASLPDSHHPRD